MGARAIIAQLRRGEVPSAEELQWFATGLATGVVTDAQAGAFAMAVCINGLGETGRVALTEAMRDSGDVLKWDLGGPVLDKHSTGGVGDCVSLLLAPALAACGVYVPMISGRGLGHTGGTLDKMEAITGVRTDVTEQRMRRIVEDAGCAIVGASATVAPADKRLYAVRDVTSTVESVDLITASILSKKLAAGLEALILDVKCGSGAFMRTQDEAKVLAKALVETAKGAGCPTAAFITDMDQPLAPALGNVTEVAVVMDVLSGHIHAAPRLFELTVALGGRLLSLGGGTRLDASDRIRKAFSSGMAMEHFCQMVRGMGGPPDMADDWRTHLPIAPVVGDIPAPRDGWIASMDGKAMGMAVVGLGGGRRVETDRVDPAVGLSDVLPLGTQVTRGQPIATIHARDEESAEAAAHAILEAVTIGEAPHVGPLILEKVE